MRPWESATVRVSRADPELDCACAIQQVPDDVIAGYTTCLEQQPLGETMNRRSLSLNCHPVSLSLGCKYFMNG